MSSGSGFRVVDETDFCLGWHEHGGRARTSHALVAGGRVWLVDPVAPARELEERVLALGEPAGVLQLLDRHERDAAALADRLGVPLHVVPEALPGTPFDVLPVLRNRIWREVALWWPEHRALVCADALGTVPFFRAGAESIGVHPFLRLRPPATLRGLGADHVLVGHGRGLHGPDTASLVDDALVHARRRLPRWLAGLPRLLRSER